LITEAAKFETISGLMEKLTENPVLTRLQGGRVKKCLPIALAVFGTFALIAGVLLAISSMTIPPTEPGSPHLPLHGAVYVGANTCYTCHSDKSHDWSLTSYAQTIVNPLAKPEIVAPNLKSTDREIQQIVVGDLADAYTTEATHRLAGRPYLHYIIRTDDGHTVLPLRWNALDSESETTKAGASSIKCGGCHTISFILKHAGVGAIALADLPDPIINRNWAGWSTAQHLEYIQTSVRRINVRL
jgi:hypothetical protein